MNTAGQASSGTRRPADYLTTPQFPYFNLSNDYRQAIDKFSTGRNAVYWIRLTRNTRIDMQLKDRLRELRVVAGLSVREAATRLGKSAGYISRIEGRGEIPTPHLLCEMADLYSAEVQELMQLAKAALLKAAEDQIETKQETALRLFRRSGERK